MAEEQTLRLAAVFSDHMVLQRGREIAVFGAGEEGRAVKARLCGQTAEGRVHNGRFQIFLPPLPAGGPFELTVASGAQSLRFTDVFVGEVWLAGGQSNMELELQNGLNGGEEVRNSANPLLRFYNVPKVAFEGEELRRAEEESAWKLCGPETSAVMSAVAYFCARKLQRELGVAVGVVDCYWGGTSVSCWMGEAQLARSAAGRKYLDDYAERVGGKTDAQYDAEMAAYNAEYLAWDARVRAARAKNPDVTWEVLNETCGICPWPQPAGRKSPFRPAGLFESMVRRAAPYSLRGFLYYQGEEDEGRCEDYGAMMAYLIDQWRGAWGDDLLPFLFVQLPRYISKADATKGQDSRHWCVLREQQARAADTVRNTGLAVTIDCGEFDNIHPLDKQTVGNRLALQALAKGYGFPVQADGPLFRRARAESAGARVWFANAGGLRLEDADGPEQSGFELAGEDGAFYPAQARVELCGGEETVFAACPQVPEPQAVRYSWGSFGAAPLFGAHGLPAAPFRGRVYR